MAWKIAFFIQFAFTIVAMIGWHRATNGERDCFIALERTIDFCGNLSCGENNPLATKQELITIIAKLVSLCGK